MKISLVLFLACLTTAVSAYGSYGAWEPISFYTAYIVAWRDGVERLKLTGGYDVGSIHGTASGGKEDNKIPRLFRLTTEVLMGKAAGKVAFTTSAGMALRWVGALRKLDFHNKLIPRFTEKVVDLEFNNGVVKTLSVDLPPNELDNDRVETYPKLNDKATAREIKATSSFDEKTTQAKLKDLQEGTAKYTTATEKNHFKNQVEAMSDAKWIEQGFRCA
jgi:hypothetical protein